MERYSVTPIPRVTVGFRFRIFPFPRQSFLLEQEMILRSRERAEKPAKARKKNKRQIYSRCIEKSIVSSRFESMELRRDLPVRVRIPASSIPLIFFFWIAFTKNRIDYLDPIFKFSNI